MNNISAIKRIKCASIFCLLHSVSYAPPFLLKKLLPCCFESPSASPTTSSRQTQPMLQNFLILGLSQNQAAAPTYKIKPLNLEEDTKEGEEEEMRSLHPQPSAPPPSPQSQSYQLPLALRSATPPFTYDQMIARNFTNSQQKTPRQQGSPPPSLIQVEEKRPTHSRNSSDDSFVMISPRKQEFEI